MRAERKENATLTKGLVLVAKTGRKVVVARQTPQPSRLVVQLLGARLNKADRDGMNREEALICKNHMVVTLTRSKDKIHRARRICTRQGSVLGLAPVDEHVRSAIHPHLTRYTKVRPLMLCVPSCLSYV